MEANSTLHPLKGVHFGSIKEDILVSIEDRVEKLVSKPINDLGYRIYDVMYVKEGKDNYLRIFIDNDKGISLDDCETVNNAITDMLDEANIIKNQYFLEISSPGIERHIRKSKHLEESLGKEIYVKLFKAIDKKKEFTGVLNRYNKEEIILSVENKELTIPRDNISLARISFNWNN